MMNIELLFEMIIGLFWALSYVQKIWKSSVTTAITVNMLFFYLLLQSFNEYFYSYAIVIIGLMWLYYRAIFKPKNDHWSV